MAKFGRQFMNQFISDRGTIHDALEKAIKESCPGVSGFIVEGFYFEEDGELGECVVVEVNFCREHNETETIKLPAHVIVEPE